jgi:guanylate kinase
MTNSKTGILIVVTGAAGAGKDAVMESFLLDPGIKKFNIEKIVSYTDRVMRPGEKEGVEHYFVTNAKLKELETSGKFVEPITKTGISNKATPKSEILKLLEGKNLIWRIDPIRGTEVISGKFFDKVFPKYAEYMNSHTLVFFVTAPQKMLEERRKRRDQNQYNQIAYKDRQEAEEPLLKILEKKAINVNNLDDKLDEAVSFVVDTVINFNEKVKNK